MVTVHATLDSGELLVLVFNAPVIMVKLVAVMVVVVVMEIVLVILDMFHLLLHSKNVIVPPYVLKTVVDTVHVIVVFVNVFLAGTFFLIVLVQIIVQMIVMVTEYATVMEHAHVIMVIMELYVTTN